MQDPTEIELQEPKPKWYLGYNFLWSLAGFLLLVVVAGSYFWWQEIKKTPSIQQNTCLAGTPPEECNDNPSSQFAIEDWKTYTNTEYGLEFKYPSHWTHRSGSEKIFILDLLFESQKDEVEIQFILNNGEFTPCEENCVRNRTENISGNNWSIYDLAYDKKHGKAGVLKKDNLRFAFISFEKVNFDSQSFDQILSTFKFTGTRVTTSGSLKTYRNDNYSFEIKFPSEWPDPRTLIPEVGVWDTVYISDGTVADGCCFGVQIDVTTDKMSIDSFYSSANVDDPDVIAEKDITFAGQKAKEVVTDTHFGANQKMIYLLFENKLYLLRIADVDKSAEQVLSTFRFTK